MKIGNKRLYGILVSLALVSGHVHADSSCWQAPELKAYDLTMQTLMLAHVAATCDGMVKADPTLKTQFGAFLGKYQQQMTADRQPLSDYYQRAYGADWEGPMQKSLAREDKRVSQQVTTAATAKTCGDASQLIQGLAAAQWQDYLNDAEAQHWHERAGFPACQ
jgi:hypothetical protein